MRRVFLWAARNAWLQVAPAAVPVHAAGGPPVHARRDAGVGARRGRAARGRRHRDDVHAARREPDQPRRGGRGRRSLHRGARRDRGARLSRRGLGQADPARPRSRRGADAGPPRPARGEGRGDRLLPVDRHGGQRLRRGDDPAVRAPARGPAADGDLPPGVSQAHAADVERLRPLDPAIRLVKGAYDEPASIAYRDKRQVDASYLAIAVDILKTGRGRRSGSVSARTTWR